MNKEMERITFSMSKTMEKELTQLMREEQKTMDQLIYDILDLYIGVVLGPRRSSYKRKA